jgi:uncharacterized membrane protein
MQYRIVEKFLFILIGFVLAFVAIVVRDCYSTMHPSFWRMSFYDLLQLSTNLFIALIIVHYLRNRYSDRQTQKNLFLGILNDIAKIFEDKSDFITEFMQKTTKPKSNRQKISLLLAKISNKITVLEKDEHLSDGKIKILVANIRDHFDNIDEIIGSGDFVKAESFSDDNINKVLKNIYGIIFLIDQIKLNVFG